MVTALTMVLTEPKARNLEVNIFRMMIFRVMMVIDGIKGVATLCTVAV